MRIAGSWNSRATVRALMMRMLVYSAMKIRANFPPCIGIES